VVEQRELESLILDFVNSGAGRLRHVDIRLSDGIVTEWLVD